MSDFDTASTRRTRRQVRLEATGQTLVEYVLIIAVVSLGAIAALSFLSERLNALYSKTRNSLEAVNDGSGPVDPPVDLGNPRVRGTHEGPHPFLVRCFQHLNNCARFLKPHCLRPTRCIARRRPAGNIANPNTRIADRSSAIATVSCTAPHIAG